MKIRSALLLMLVLGLAAAACGKKTPPVARPAPPPITTADNTGARPPAPPEPLAIDSIASASLDDLNRNSPLKPVFFELDSNEIGGAAQAVLNENAAVMKRYPTWTITIEGHADERGTAEYNLALGERRALAARAYLVTLGIPADRLKTVSYGKEFPFDPGHDEAAYGRNRRAHFVVTAK